MVGIVICISLNKGSYLIYAGCFIKFFRHQSLKRSDPEHMTVIIDKAGGEHILLGIDYMSVTAYAGQDTGIIPHIGYPPVSDGNSLCPGILGHRR